MKRAVICFTRVPKPGTTKTRLLGLLTPDQCARLHWAFLWDLSRIYDRVVADLFISHTPDPDWTRLKTVFPNAAGWFPQSGKDLGEKMHNAIAAVLAMDYEAVVLTGADLPLMRVEHLESGFNSLRKNKFHIFRVFAAQRQRTPYSHSINTCVVVCAHNCNCLTARDFFEFSESLFESIHILVEKTYDVK